ncbi:MAG: PorV/PorQ family protein [candidate division Zixibacteria bacterium]|nr:PorV/PorQ family protein [candidate division Zixibacteria bacterium]
MRGEFNKTRIKREAILSFSSFVFILLFLIFPVQSSWGILSVGERGTTGANFLKIGVGARASGMGGAFVGVADDATSIYWNTAGLSQLERQEIVFVHNQWYQDVKYEYFGYSLPVKAKSTLGFSITYLNLGDFQGYDDSDNLTSGFSAYGAVLGLAYAHKVSSSVSFGLGLKWIQEKLEEEKAASLALDFGFIYKPGRFSLGMTYTNLGSSMKFIREKEPLPSELTIGIGYKLFQDRVSLAWDLNFPRDDKMVLKQGLEYGYEESIFLRMGYEYKTSAQNLSGTGFSLGGGFRFSDWEVDYTYSPNQNLGDSHRISLSYRFGSIRVF